MVDLNPIIELAELVQKQYGKSIETKVLSKTGADHIPEIEVEIKLPDGRKFEAAGKNKRLAKRKAAQIALDNFVETNNECADCQFSNNGKTACIQKYKVNKHGIQSFCKVVKSPVDEVKPNNYL